MMNTQKNQPVFQADYQKISRDYGNLCKLASSFEINKKTLEHIIYKKTTLSFRSDDVRKAVNALLSQGYLKYTTQED